jgi:hypothetical protein
LAQDAQSEAAHYRERAAETLKLAEEALAEDTRSFYMELATKWGRLADQAERLKR